jgi:NAD(P)-dependent dehydrogenase (short-subunit alcohol dehydrogenase family)
MKNVVITGANRGIGFELAKLYALKGYAVTGICRDTSVELEDIAEQVISGIDLTATKAIEAVGSLVEQLIDGPVHILINNAGIFSNETLDDLNLARIRQQFEVNAIIPLQIAHALLPLMEEGSKIANITSRMGSMGDNGSGGYYGYRASKAALNAFGKSLAVDLKDRGIAVAQIHPGFVQTRMVNFQGEITPEQAASGIMARIAQLDMLNTGSFWHSNGQELPW